LGAIVPPGSYTVRLSTGKAVASSGGAHAEGVREAKTQSLEIKIDPRVKATRASLAEQYALALKITDAMNSSFASLEQVRAVRAQLKARVAKVRGAPYDALIAFDRKTAEFEGSAQRFGPQSKQDSFAKLNAQLGQLLASVDSADAAPTETARKTYAALRQSLAAVEKRWDEAKARDLPALNVQLRAAGQPPIDWKEPPPQVFGPSEEDEP
jgi:hypothetical protein